MSLISISFYVLAVGILLWFVNTSIPMSKKFHGILNVVVFVCVVVWLLSAFGILSFQWIFNFLTAW